MVGELAEMYRKQGTTPIVIHTVRETCSGLSRSSFYTYLSYSYVTVLAFLSH